VLPTPRRRATSRDGSLPSNVSRKISRTLRIASLSVGIGYPTKWSSLRRPDRPQNILDTIAITQEP
jgi:hypothetical protein